MCAEFSPHSSASSCSLARPDHHFFLVLFQALLDHLPIMVSFACRRFLTLLARSGLRARVESASAFVSRVFVSFEIEIEDADFVFSPQRRP